MEEVRKGGRDQDVAPNTRPRVPGETGHRWAVQRGLLETSKDHPQGWDGRNREERQFGEISSRRLFDKHWQFTASQVP